jgi:F420-dependent hydroxymycolic acid dehydrogenase
MGTTVTSPTLRYNPAVVAEAFATLESLAPGHILLGVGSGEALNEQAAIGSWPNWAERSQRLIEATKIIRQMWTGQQLAHHGAYYKVNARLYDSPANTIPLLMAANGPKAMHRTGQNADGLVTDPKTWKEHKSEFEAGAKAAGKVAGKMPVLVEQYDERKDGGNKQTGLILDPFMIHETFPYLTETVFGSHPCRVVSVTYRQLRPL